MRLCPTTMRPIAALLIATFLCQDIVWANPEIIEKGFSPSTLQIQPISKNIFTGMPSIRAAIESRMVQIFRLYSLESTPGTIDALKRFRVKTWDYAKGGVTIESCFDSAYRYMDSDVFVIPYDVFAGGATPVRCYCLIDSGKEPLALTEDETARVLDSVRAGKTLADAAGRTGPATRHLAPPSTAEPP